MGLYIFPVIDDTPPDEDHTAYQATLALDGCISVLVREKGKKSYVAYFKGIGTGFCEMRMVDSEWKETEIHYFSDEQARDLVYHWRPVETNNKTYRRYDTRLKR